MNQNKQAPIGVFDSGVGGLTVAREIMRNLPGERIVYFGDTARVPYGSKSKDIVLKYSRQIVRFLQTQDVKAIVVACNTASAMALETIREEIDIPIIGVVKPGAKVAAQTTRNKKIGLIGTRGTVKSELYPAIIHEYDPQIQVIGQACPLLVPLVEEGWLKDEVTVEVAKRYLDPLLEQGVDTLILGCTHYPLLADVIGDVMGPGVELVSAGEESAFELKRMLKTRDLRADEERRGETEFYVSDRVEDFEQTASLFLQEDLYHMARRIDIERY